MGKIILLDIELANQIAAGEVIERPASVVKELVENSIDAGSTQVYIELEEAGRKKIIVRDDGSGISAEDLPLAFARHATSKLKSSADLFRIKSLGFRGEALPSIASIAKVVVETATSSESGTSAQLVGGEIKMVPYAAAKGTKIIVENLFYNTPARLKYLKQDYTENSVTFDLVSKIALAHPEIQISLVFDGKERFKTSGRGSLEETILNIYGLNHVKNLVPFTFETYDFKGKGYLGNSNLMRTNRYGIITSLNGRNVYMPKVQATIIEAYHGFIAPTRYPFVILNLNIEPELVDVNVHPTKKEVRFSKEEELRQILLTAIPKALRTDEFIPTPNQVLNFKSEEAGEFIAPTQIKFDLFDSFSKVSDEQTLVMNDDNDNTSITPFVSFKNEIKLDVIPLASISQTYIICETNEGGFWLIDQHAAHERINYEKFNRVLNENLRTRPLLIPELLTFSQSEMDVFTKENLELLADVGLEAEVFGANTLRVTAVPSWAGEYDEKVYITGIINDVTTKKTLNKPLLRTNAIATMACKASIKAKHRLSIAEMNHLIAELLACHNPYSCPHGRPTIIKFSKYELEKMFKRTGL